MVEKACEICGRESAEALRKVALRRICRVTQILAKPEARRDRTACCHSENRTMKLPRKLKRCEFLVVAHTVLSAFRVPD
jgi:hypothetical protein